MKAEPRLTVGLPVYNGENYLAESLESLLGQSYDNFELIISDNASTDGTADICRRYGKQDSRIRYVRQPRNIGAAPNHNYLVRQARGELFKWASHDDLYARDLLKRCIDVLDEFPQVILAHSWTARIDATGAVLGPVEYALSTASPRAPERFRSLLFDRGGDDDGGVIRTSVLRQTRLIASYHHADRTFVAALGLRGQFYQVPDWLYFRRDHAERAEWAFKTVRAWCANLDPRRDDWHNPAIRLYAEYIWGYIDAVRKAPLSTAEKRECYHHFVRWLVSRERPRRARKVIEPPYAPPAVIPFDAVVAGRENRDKPEESRPQGNRGDFQRDGQYRYLGMDVRG
jgi:glycosyltransferase involved in cell wall biosynthesis